MEGLYERRRRELNGLRGRLTFGRSDIGALGCCSDRTLRRCGRRACGTFGGNCGGVNADTHAGDVCGMCTMMDM